jgi:hypothetical protein
MSPRLTLDIFCCTCNIQMSRRAFTFQMFWENGRTVEPFLKPLTLELDSIDEARKLIEKVVGNPKIPLHSVTIVSADRTTSERWFQLDGAWRQRPDRLD